MAQLQPRNQGLGVPQNGPHDGKPEGIRLTTNAISGLKPRRTRYDVTDPGSSGVQLRGHAEWSESAGHRDCCSRDFEYREAPTDLSDDPDNVPKDAHSVLFSRTGSITDTWSRSASEDARRR